MNAGRGAKKTAAWRCSQFPTISVSLGLEECGAPSLDLSPMLPITFARTGFSPPIRLGGNTVLRKSFPSDEHHLGSGGATGVSSAVCAV